MKIYFVRHGQTDANTNMQNGGRIQELDAPLNTIGKQQAKELAEELKGKHVDLIITSPLRRAKETAEIINTHHNIPLTIANELREREAGTYIDTNVWHELFDFDKNIPVKDGESLHNFFERVYRYLDKLKQLYPDKTVLLVSHGGVQHALYAYAQKLPHSGNMRISPMGNCEYREYEV